jgi:putative transposase
MRDNGVPHQRAKADRALAVDVAAVHAESRHSYGSPRIHRALRVYGRCVLRKRVARVIREQGLRGRGRRRFVRTTDSQHGFPIATNHVNQAFTVAAPNTVWVGDITYVATREGWLYPGRAPRSLFPSRHRLCDERPTDAPARAHRAS